MRSGQHWYVCTAFLTAAAKAILLRAEEVGYLMLDYLEPAVAAKLTSAFKEIAQQILEGRVISGVGIRFNDQSTTDEYLKGLQMMLDAVQAAESTSRNSGP